MILLFSIFYFIPALVSFFAVLKYDILNKSLGMFTVTKLMIGIVPFLNIVVTFFEIISWFIGFDRTYDLFFDEKE